MEGTIGEVRMFGGNFAPRGWQFCDGTLYPISQYDTVYAILGTTYGGDGQTTFGVPNMCGRVAVGTGQGPGLSNYVSGQLVGSEQVTLLNSQMPAHTHASTSTGGGGTITATATLNASATAGGDATPANEVLGIDTGGTALIYGADTGTLVPMATSALSLSNLSPGKLPVVTLGISGNNLPHENIQPYLSVNFIICFEGIFPNRN